MDESKRYTVGSCESLEEAVNKCKETTIKVLRDLCQIKGILPENLKTQWIMFGEDPYVFGGAGVVPFSARKFVSAEFCKEIIDFCENDCYACSLTS